MSCPLELKSGKWMLVAGPRFICPALLSLTARLAGRGPVRVLDGGNQFNVYRVSRAVRGQPETPSQAARGVLERITVARAFTCYQMLSLLESTADAPAPFILLDLLGAFYDESVPGPERLRLLRQCLSHLRRLSRRAGGVVSVHPPAVPSGLAAGMFEMLALAADEIWQPSLPPHPVSQPPLFQLFTEH